MAVFDSHAVPVCNITNRDYKLSAYAIQDKLILYGYAYLRYAEGRLHLKLPNFL